MFDLMVTARIKLDPVAYEQLGRVNQGKRIPRALRAKLGRKARQIIRRAELVVGKSATTEGAIIIRIIFDFASRELAQHAADRLLAAGFQQVAVFKRPVLRSRST